ncbi:hypothetical protein Dpo_3c02810 [Desulfotignum phosphitoxidans DSM 13687]|uniref:Uncharacterized protein n=1 Tax=Desulfotignum phosphitoxidans DSM 13687 TaxID=1286635 RepID=S0FUR5_9BACT|nr:hypothetical protein Dpo_8c01170 [Desulfotignum phosphitoxidans DSM 13687]EMS80137.1 hypothetical protein Dpo_3c02810 [Desulfotignum phosphitoxidans DSM 13687]
MARNNTEWEISINFVPFESTEIRDKSYELWANSFNHFQKRTSPKIGSPKNQIPKKRIYQKKTMCLKKQSNRQEVYYEEEKKEQR